MAQGTSVRAAVTVQDVIASGRFANQTQDYGLNLRAALADGTNADQADRYGVAVIDFTASNAQTINIRTALTDQNGATFNVSEVTTWATRLVASNANATVTIAPANTNGWTALYTGTGMVHRAGTNSNPAFTVICAPCDPAYTVTNSNLQLTITPSAHASTLTIVAVGRSV